jgi:hypothetical protein
MGLGRLAAYRNRRLEALTVFIQARNTDAVDGQPSWEPDSVENDYYRFQNYPRS